MWKCAIKKFKFKEKKKTKNLSKVDKNFQNCESKSERISKIISNENRSQTKSAQKAFK